MKKVQYLFSFLFLISSINCDILPSAFLKEFHQILNDNIKLSNKSDVFRESIWPADGQRSQYDDQLCSIQFQYLLDSFQRFEFWALNVIDSWAKIPSGILYGNFWSPGNFDQCLNVSETIDSNAIGTIKGQYCTAIVSLPIDLNGNDNVNKNNFIDLKQIFNQFVTIKNNTERGMAAGMDDIMGAFAIQSGICVPNTCSPHFMKSLIDQVLNATTQLETFPIKTAIVFCQEDQPIEYRALDIFAICLFSFIGFLMMASTVYDVLLMKMDKPRNPNLLAFSMYTNGGKIFKCTPNRSNSTDMLECVNGIRVLSIVWVVMGHTYATSMLTMSNLLTIFEWVKEYSSQLLLSATISVDTFFFLSGMLVAWSILKHLDANKGRINIFLLYFHRYLRLTPSLAATILAYMTFLRLWSRGPFSFMADSGMCDKDWWSTLLYVQNYVNPGDTCLGHAWYLSIDMQLFIFSPIFVYAMWRWKEKAVPFVAVFVFLSMGCSFTTMMLNKFSASMMAATTNDRMEKVYIKTPIRMGVWFVGILTGFVLHSLRGKRVNLSRFYVTLGWIVSLVVIFSVVFGMYDINQLNSDTTIFDNAMYESFSRVTWGIALAWIVFACVHGYGGPINWFLSWPQWQPLSRLSYSIYMTHVLIQMYFMASAKSPTYFSDIRTVHRFWGDFGLTLTLSVFWTMAFESPIVTLEKMLLGKGKRTNQAKNVQKPVEDNTQS